MNELKLREHQQRLKRCHRCPEMTGPALVGEPVLSPAMLSNQKEGNWAAPLPGPPAKPGSNGPHPAASRL